MPAVEDAIERSPLPAAVRVVVDRVVEANPEAAARLEGDDAVRAAVVAVAAASRSLGRLLETDAGALDVLADLDGRPPVDDTDADGLVRWKQREFLRIAARDLLGLDRLEDTGEALAVMAADALDAACRIAGASDLAVIGMGKLGGSELNYASDVDVMFVGDGDQAGAERRAKGVIEIARRCFRVDVNLRPEGRNGPLARSLDAFEAYWERWAQPWEFQALLKARPVAGDRTRGEAFDDAARRALWTRSFSADDIRSLRSMKERSEAEVTRKGHGDRELKQSPGGIRDIEFAVQLLQLVHGRHDDELRSPTTLTALARFGSTGFVDPDDAAALADAYRFLRTVEHRVQLVEEQQVHALPRDAETRVRVARVLGYRDTPDADAPSQLEAELRRRQAAVRSIHERVYFRPLLEAFSAGDGALVPEAAAERLAAFGFTDADRTRQAVRELTRGLTRASRLMQQLLPLLLGWLSETPDPDLGLLGLRNLVSGPQRSTELAVAFRDSPESARRLCRLLGTSRLLGDGLLHNPDLIAELGAAVPGPARSRDDLVEGARTALVWRGEADEQNRALKRFKDRELLRIAGDDVLELAGLEQTEAAVSALAEATLEASLDVLDPTLPFAVVAMGRFGGAELSYASDLDVLFVFDGEGATAFEQAEHVATALMRFVSGSTPSARLFELDADLRPEGKQGPLARSLSGYRTYYERWAKIWERQALLRARPVAGDRALGDAFVDVARSFVRDRPLGDDDVREIRRIKARVERERIPAGEDPQFHLKLGRGSLSDVEWTAQLLQLQHGISASGTMAALDGLREAGVMADDDAATLAASYRFCERARNRLFLVRGGPGDALPTQAGQLARLARSMDLSPAELREEYRRVTRRARAVVERLFYGRDDRARTGA